MGTKLVVNQTELPGVMLIDSLRHSDNRGTFSRWFCQNELNQWLNSQSIRQSNHSVNLANGTVRGMHFLRPPLLEYKLVRCIRGSICDAVVDLRQNSPTFLKHQLFELNEKNHHMLVIPPGFAHGFQSLEDNSQLLYFTTADYQIEYDDGCRFDDPKIGISWPLPVSQISQRDMEFPLLNDSFNGLNFA